MSQQMLLQVILFSISAVIASSVVSPKQNNPNAVKNETGAVFFFPPPIFTTTTTTTTTQSAGAGGAGAGGGYMAQMMLPISIFIPKQVTSGGGGEGGAGGAESAGVAVDYFYCSSVASFLFAKGDVFGTSAGGSSSSGSSSSGNIQMGFPVGQSFDGPEVGMMMPMPMIPIGGGGTGGGGTSGGGAGGGTSTTIETSRQFCRYTATTSDAACDFCCKIAARHYFVTASEVVGMLVVFDPRYPPIINATSSSGSGSGSGSSSSSSYTSVMGMGGIAGESYMRKKRDLMNISPVKSSAHLRMKRFSPILIAPGPAPLPALTSTTTATTASTVITTTAPAAGGTTEAPSSTLRPIPQCFCCAPKKYFS